MCEPVSGLAGRRALAASSCEVSDTLIIASSRHKPDHYSSRRVLLLASLRDSSRVDNTK